jgi:lysophospholipase L1-like esterase
LTYYVYLGLHGHGEKPAGGGRPTTALEFDPLFDILSYHTISKTAGKGRGDEVRFRVWGLLLLAGCTLAAGIAGVAFTRWYYHRVCADVPCPHLGDRVSTIISVIGQQHASEQVYLAIGDSITEWADLPNLCGRKPINAGIGWATSATFQELAKELADRAKPDFIVIELGTNDALRGKTRDFRARMSEMLSSLNAVPLLLVPVQPAPLVPDREEINHDLSSLGRPIADTLHGNAVVGPDGIHLSLDGYSEWKKTIQRVADDKICPILSPR